MAKFEFEIIKRLEIVTTVVIRAKDEEEAEEKVKEKIENGLCDQITWIEPKGWHTETDETDFQLR